MDFYHLLFISGKAWLGFNDIIAYHFLSKDSVRKWQLLCNEKHIKAILFVWYLLYNFLQISLCLESNWLCFVKSFGHLFLLLFLFTVYLVTQGVNPREHGIKQELVCNVFSVIIWYFHFFLYLFALCNPSVTLLCSSGANQDVHEQSERDYRQEESSPFE